MNYLLGVDLGQAQDFTALCVLELTGRETGRVKTQHYFGTWSTGPSGEVHGTPYARIQTPILEHLYAVRHLERLPIGTPYPKQVEHVRGLHDRLKREGHTVKLVVDQTGVGRPVVDMLRSAELSPTAITITGGDSVTHEGSAYRVPKRDLVSTVQVLLQSERLKIASSLPEAQTLIDELLAFKVTITTTGHDRYGNDVGLWRENPHDDLVLAVALAAWWGENGRQSPPPPPPPRARVFRTAR